MMSLMSSRASNPECTFNLCHQRNMGIIRATLTEKELHESNNFEISSSRTYHEPQLLFCVLPTSSCGIRVRQCGLCWSSTRRASLTGTCK